MSAETTDAPDEITADTSEEVQLPHDLIRSLVFAAAPLDTPPATEYSHF